MKKIISFQARFPAVMQKKRTIQNRRVNLIQYTDSTRKANLLTKRGRESQTASLNINLKTINKNELLKMPILSIEEKNIIADYLSEKANFTATRKLFGVQQTQYSQQGHNNILKYMHCFYRSSNFIEKILRNESMNMQNKLILLKFAQKIKESTINPRRHTNWKQKF